MPNKKYTTLQSVIHGTKAHAPGAELELDPESESTKHLLATKHVEETKPAKPGRVEGDKK